MAVAVTAGLAIFWLAVAYRELRRGDLLLSGVFLLVGIVLTAFRIHLQHFGRKVSSAPPVVFPPETSLLSVQELVPAGFKHGVEILNDDRTPMEFVVSVLGTHLGLSRTDAIKNMLKVHTRGGVL